MEKSKKSIKQKVEEYMEILGVYVPDEPEENADESTENTCIE